MPRDIRFHNRPLLDGLIEIYLSSRLRAVLSFILILFISSVIPLSIIWLVQVVFLDISIIPISSKYLKVFFTIWSLAEVGFLIYQSYLYSIIQRCPTSIPQLTETEREKIISKSLSNMKDPRHTLSKWFLEHPSDQIDRQSLVGWLAFAFYSSKVDQLTAREHERLEQIIEQIENEYEITFPTMSFRTKSVNYMKHILDPVRIIFRPLVFYIVTDTLLNSILARSIFHWQNYEFVQIGSLSFWTYRNPNLNSHDEDDPIIFFHGIGAGLLMYQPFFARIHQQFSHRRRIILISMRCISMRYPSLNDIPNMPETVSSIKLIFEHYRMKKAIFIGHRFVFNIYC